MENGKMLAAFYEKPNEISIKETNIPAIGYGEALVKVSYTGICGSDIHVYHGQHATATYPRIPGHEFSGELVAVEGPIRDGLKAGDAVLVQPTDTCTLCEPCITGHDNVCQDLKILGIHVDGGFAQYVRVPARKVYRMPSNISPRLGAIAEPLAVAIHDVRTSGIQAGQKALIIGGGPIGILIGLVAQQTGAIVYISEINKFRLSFIKELGLNTIDAGAEDSRAQMDAITGGKGFDVVYEVSGSKPGQRMMTDVAKIRGKIIAIGMGGSFAEVNIGQLIAKEQNIEGVRVHSQVNYEGAVEMLKLGVLNDKLDKLITKEFTLDKFDEAIKYQIEDPEHFKVVVKIND